MFPVQPSPGELCGGLITAGASSTRRVNSRAAYLHRVVMSRLGENRTATATLHVSNIFTRTRTRVMFFEYMYVCFLFVT